MRLLSLLPGACKTYHLRYAVAVALIIVTPACVAAQGYSDLLQAGKDSIAKERSKTAYEKCDFTAAINLLKAAEQKKPADPEVHYFLGSAYDYDNCPSASNILQTTLQKTIRASNEFERVIRLSPKYSGEIIALDPYSKISSIWGSLAYRYAAEGKHDSAVWAFGEGKRRGGYLKFGLEYFRAIMNEMDHNAIVFTYGDFSTMHLWYLQEVEHLRTDIIIINLSMLGIEWYTELLDKNIPSLFSSHKVAKDTTLFKKWKTTTYEVPVQGSHNTFKWVVKPLHYDLYVFREDLELIDIIRNNKFRRPVFIEKGVNDELTAGLTEHVTDCMNLYRLSPTVNGIPRHGDEFFSRMNTFDFGIVKDANSNCNEERSAINYLRYNFVAAIAYLFNQHKDEDAKKMYARMNKVLPQDEFPYDNDKTLTQYIDAIRERIDDN